MLCKIRFHFYSLLSYKSFLLFKFVKKMMNLLFYFSFINSFFLACCSLVVATLFSIQCKQFILCLPRKETFMIHGVAIDTSIMNELVSFAILTLACFGKFWIASFHHLLYCLCFAPYNSVLHNHRNSIFEAIYQMS